ncbi:MAG: ATP-binding cassette domain-containing protein [Propionibacteriaceae bacterium]|jgi:ABC-type lipoprotein export system ATPase subunit|nr:ATP-binding cassette domain-containing protein [Propionibacteriaceae bacterium]
MVDVSHQFPGTGLLFRGLSLDLVAGDLVGLTGPSGSGKSTLLSLLAGWERPTQGQIVWDGVGSVGWVFQNPYGVPGRTALDHVALPLLAKGSTRRAANEKAVALLDRFGLSGLAERPYSALSGGEAQRLMLARAMAKSPDLLLVDEPTAQLDPAAAARVDDVLGQLANSSTIVVVATHDPRTAAACDRVVDLAGWWSGVDGGRGLRRADSGGGSGGAESGPGSVEVSE